MGKKATIKKMKKKIAARSKQLDYASRLAVLRFCLAPKLKPDVENSALKSVTKPGLYITERPCNPQQDTVLVNVVLDKKGTKVEAIAMRIGTNLYTFEENAKAGHITKESKAVEASLLETNKKFSEMTHNTCSLTALI